MKTVHVKPKDGYACMFTGKRDFRQKKIIVNKKSDIIRQMLLEMLENSCYLFASIAINYKVSFLYVGRFIHFYEVFGQLPVSYMFTFE